LQVELPVDALRRDTEATWLIGGRNHYLGIDFIDAGPGYRRCNGDVHILGVLGGLTSAATELCGTTFAGRCQILAYCDFRLRIYRQCRDPVQCANGAADKTQAMAVGNTALFKAVIKPGVCQGNGFEGQEYPTPAAVVLNWLNEQESSALYVSTITIGEITYGLRILPDGKRRTELHDKFEQFIAQAFAQRVVDYDEPCARIYGEIMGARKELGRPMSIPDGQIAAIAQRNRLIVATRNVADFEACRVDLIDPFSTAV